MQAGCIATNILVDNVVSLNIMNQTSTKPSTSIQLRSADATICHVLVSPSHDIVPVKAGTSAGPLFI